MLRKAFVSAIIALAICPLFTYALCGDGYQQSGRGSVSAGVWCCNGGSSSGTARKLSEFQAAAAAAGLTLSAAPANMCSGPHFNASRGGGGGGGPYVFNIEIVHKEKRYTLN